MRLTPRFLQQACRITFYTRSTCSLCTTAKGVLESLQTKSPFYLIEKDVDMAHHKKWKDIYDFDVPVIHVEKSSAAEDGNPSADQKLMHRFTEDQVSSLMEKVLASSR
ncbi:hypothetical protein FH972_025626 [Carpinus fangiana]|uniref:Glutaredoxin-like protein n=1 Tax=Carpinus fangiana TaxID=176857 RepID=A0A5N6L1J9_9ROSI|nr:hypothetical protein FH972_025626 [Carpinus fangiana]